MSDPAVFDDARDDLMAPPPLCVRFEWPVVSDRALRAGYGAEAAELLRGVHAQQDSIFHRPVRAGDRLTTDGQIIAVEGTRAGARTLMRLDTRDAAGRPVVTSYTTSIFRGVAVSGPNIVLARAPSLPAGTRRRGDRTTIAVAREFPHVYTECAAIWNPIHTERRVALRAGLPDIIVHGTATWALAARELILCYAPGRPERLRRLSGRFNGMAIPGHPLTLEHGELSSGVVWFEVRSHRDQPVLSDGIAIFDPAAARARTL
jgi:acyl dehydratase